MRVMTNGCFDIFHLGHLEMLNFARSLGEELFIAINSDLSIKKLKGNGRPILEEDYRLSFLNALPFVTKAQIFNDKRCTELIYKWKPDIYIKSSDYNLENLDKSEKKALEDINCEIRFMEIKTNISTSSIINKIKIKSNL
tara:strand:+ start:19 stop:438 length:420 start_codon:yes stop_codon:yes gene_type:complete